MRRAPGVEVARIRSMWAWLIGFTLFALLAISKVVGLALFGLKWKQVIYAGFFAYLAWECYRRIRTR